MNTYYKLLIYFQNGEKISRSFLLRKPNITAELIEDALTEGYIVKASNCESDGIKYIITQKGIEKRDE